ncbi:MAG: 2TM domain-containing protein [Promethearchaeota archaeon]
MNLNSGFSEENLRNIAAQKVSFRFSVKIHVVIFIIVNVLLSFVNFFFTPDLYWIVFPFFSWLIGVNMHMVAYVLYARGVHPMAKRGIIYHVNSFIFVMLFLFIVNFITLSGIYWVVFPAIFWGTGVILHLIIYSMYYGVDIEKSGKRESRKERAIEKELAKMRKKQSKKT